MHLTVETVDSIVKDVGVSCYPPVVGKVSPELEGEAEPAISLESLVQNYCQYGHIGGARQKPHHLDLRMYVVRHLWW